MLRLQRLGLVLPGLALRDVCCRSEIKLLDVCEFLGQWVCFRLLFIVECIFNAIAVMFK